MPKYLDENGFAHFWDNLKKKFAKVPAEDQTDSNKSLFFNPLDNTGDVPLYITTSDGTNLANHISSGFYNSIALGHQDVAAATTLANSYIIHGDKLTYGNDKTGITYEGTWENPTPIDPRELRDSLGRMPIDCNTLTQLIGHGVVYNESAYNRDGGNYYRHKMFELTGRVAKSYWLHDYNGDREVGFGRTLTWSFAKMLFDAGKLTRVNVGTSVTYPMGAIMFSGNVPGKFLGIGHCYMIIGKIGSGTAGLVTIEATSSDPDGYGIVTGPMSSMNIAYTKAYYMPPFYELADSMMNAYISSETNRNLKTNPVTWNQPTLTTFAAVISLCPTTNVVYNLTVRITPQGSNAYGKKAMSATTNNISGPYILRIPHGYDVNISSTTNAAFNINYQKISSDRYIRIPTQLGV